MHKLIALYCLLPLTSALTIATKTYLPPSHTAAGALALDGSPFAYYVSRGAEPTKFVLFQKGGGWCFTDLECAARALTELGSSNSTFLPPSIAFETFSETSHFMLLFSNATISPLTHNWTKIYLPYLDGSSQTSDVTDPIAVGARTIFYRGARIHRATVATLLAVEGLASATDVVLSGGSAGGLSTFLHADSWRESILAASPAAKVVAVPDSGFFLNYNATGASHGPKAPFGAAMRWVFNRGNGTGGVPPACLAANPSDPALCMFAEVVSKTLVTPTLAQQSTYDSFQVASILQQPASNVTAVNAYGALVGARVSADLLSSGQGHGVFLDSCFHHVGEWDLITIDGTTISQALAEFYSGVGKPGGKRVWTQGKKYPCAACCKNGQRAAGMAAAAPPRRPRLIISSLQDDWGFASASFNRPPSSPALPEQATPHLDALASSGVVLARHYAHSFCSPTRSSFLSGRLPVHVQSVNVQPDMPNAGIPAAMTTLPEQLAALGWVSHVAGKWDVGMATMPHTPEGRGFNSSLIFFSHAVDAFTHNDVDGLCGQKYVDLWDSGAPARRLNGTDYFDALALERVLSVIATHDFNAAPLYLHWTPHVTHNPLQAPRAYLEALNYTLDDENKCSFSVDTSPTGAVFPGGPSGTKVACRRTFEAMAKFADDAMGQVVAAIAARGVWDDTLLVWQSDNGGTANLEFGGGSNFPLRGGKATWWEGGMRVAAMVGGGFLPAAARGTRVAAMTHTADWLATLCGLAGGDAAFCGRDGRAAAAGAPPIESLDLWPLITGTNATSPRLGFAASPSTLVSGKYKLLLGDVGSASWMGEVWPNASSPQQNVEAFTAHCGAEGCLYDVEGDPGEHSNVAGENAGVVARMKAELAAATKTFWINNETGVCAHNKSLSIDSACACDAASVVWGGFMGPYAEEAGAVRE